MDIQEFFQLSAGKWFSQRTSYHLALNEAENGKSDLIIELLSKDEPAVIKLCEQYAIDSTLAWGGVRITWKNLMELSKAKQVGSSVLVPIADPDQPGSGKLLSDRSNTHQIAAASRYMIGKDDVLTVITDDKTLYSEERLWFASPNLRLRTNTIKRADGFSMTSFCSEIRMGVTAAPPAQATNAANV